MPEAHARTAKIKAEQPKKKQTKKEHGHYERLEAKMKIGGILAGGVAISALTVVLGPQTVYLLITLAGAATFAAFPDEILDWVDNNHTIILGAAIGSLYNPIALFLFASVGYYAKQYWDTGVSTLKDAKEKVDPFVSMAFSAKKGFGWLYSKVTNAFTMEPDNGVSDQEGYTFSTKESKESKKAKEPEEAEMQFYDFEEFIDSEPTEEAAEATAAAEANTERRVVLFSQAKAALAEAKKSAKRKETKKSEPIITKMNEEDLEKCKKLMEDKDSGKKRRSPRSSGCGIM